VTHLDNSQVEMGRWQVCDSPKRMRRVPVLAETKTLVVRARQPLTSETVTKERLFAFPHVASN
jgi:hypothetical protein